MCNGNKQLALNPLSRLFDGRIPIDFSGVSIRDTVTNQSKTAAGHGGNHQIEKGSETPA